MRYARSPRRALPHREREREARGRDRVRPCDQPGRASEHARTAAPPPRSLSGERAGAGLRHNVTARATDRREITNESRWRPTLVVVVVVRRAPGSGRTERLSRPRAREPGRKIFEKPSGLRGALQRARAATRRRSGYPGTRAARSDVRLARSDVGLGERAPRSLSPTTARARSLRGRCSMRHGRGARDSSRR